MKKLSFALIVYLSVLAACSTPSSSPALKVDSTLVGNWYTWPAGAEPSTTISFSFTDETMWINGLTSRVYTANNEVKFEANNQTLFKYRILQPSEWQATLDAYTAANNEVGIYYTVSKQNWCRDHGAIELTDNVTQVKVQLFRR
ncbi:MAG: hypothetical protein LBV68_09130 [Spirochaetaceae bacterium]|jgi:hypothetical protein|nr:hypothetical protein [Spirochaetaceae bacterium]